MTCGFRYLSGLSGGDLVLVRESGEALFSADPVPGEVDLRWPAVGMSGCERAKGAARPGSGAVLENIQSAPGAGGAHWRSATGRTARGGGLPVIVSQMALALGACGGQARILTPPAVNTASKEVVNWPARSLIRNLTGLVRALRSITKLRAACAVHAPSEFAKQHPITREMTTATTAASAVTPGVSASRQKGPSEPSGPAAWRPRSWPA
jgi:hypothetical protein